MGFKLVTTKINDRNKRKMNEKNSDEMKRNF